MSVRVLVDGSGPGVQLPAHMTRIPISSIAEGTDGADKIVKGKMLRKGPLVSSQVHHFILKAVVQEDDSSINLVLMGALAKSFSDSVQPGDVVAVSGFSVGKSPTMHQDKLHTCNLLLSGDDACVYLFRPSPPLTPRPPPLTSKRSPALPREPGDFLRIYNLRAIEGPAKQSHLTADQPEGACPLTFHLHGGTSYGRGIRVLSENSADVRELQRVIQTSACHHGPFEDSDSDLLDVWCTPPECLDGGAEKSWTERRCCHGEQPETLAALRSVGPGGVHHVRVQLKSYQPQRLHQALKLYCTQCKTIGDVPDDGLLAQIFSEARGDSERCCTAPWLLSGEIHLPGGTVSLHLPSEFISEGRTKELIFLQGSTLEETCLLADSYQNLVPVRSSGDGLTLLDLTAPFLFRGRKRYYGCPRCSEAILKEPVAEGDQLQDETTVAESLGVVLLKFVLVLKLELQDATDLLEVFLWKYAETFFGVSAENVAADQTSQDAVRQTMEVLCPPGGSAAQHPWLDLCLAGYRAENDGGGGQACYQICHTTVTPP